jgi:hypothetical protein
MLIRGGNIFSWMKVSKTTRIPIAGMAWTGVGLHLSYLAIHWLEPFAGTGNFISYTVG